MRTATLFLTGMALVLALIAVGFTGPPGPATISHDAAISQMCGLSAIPAPGLAVAPPTANDPTRPWIDTAVLTRAFNDRSTTAPGYTEDNYPLVETSGHYVAFAATTPRHYLLL